MSLLQSISNSQEGKLAILIDPDKTKDREEIEALTVKLNILCPDFLFIGGSTVSQEDFNSCIALLKEHTKIPVVIFPGSHQQISDKADGILFLSLLSGRNPDYLIGQQILSASRLKVMDIEIMPTAYLLIDGGKPSSVAYVSQTNPIPADKTAIAAQTAIAGEMLGFKLVFMDAGSGAAQPVSYEMIKAVKASVDIPLIVGGGIASLSSIDAAFSAGADVVVIGNKIEEDIDFLLDIKSYLANKK